MQLGAMREREKVSEKESHQKEWNIIHTIRAKTETLLGVED